MRFKKVITVFLILVMVLQLLPVKQAVRYFFVDNLIIEEILHINKNATKNFRVLDEDHFMPVTDFSLHYHFSLAYLHLFHFAEMLPAVHTADIHTPPPNTPLLF